MLEHSISDDKKMTEKYAAPNMHEVATDGFHMIMFTLVMKCYYQ